MEFRRAQRLENNGRFSEALDKYDVIIANNSQSDIALESARRGARISYFETEEFLRSIDYYNFIVVNSSDSSERHESQRIIASIYFEKLTDYKNAIVHYNKLLSLPNTKEENISYRLSVARAHFYLNDFFQALAEVERALEEANSPERKFDLKLFKANILFNTKKIEKAIEIYKQLQDLNPQRAKEQNVGMNIVVSYEELNKFNKAISLLEDMRNDYEDKDFIDLKIVRLQERISNLPGARGLRK